MFRLEPAISAGLGLDLLETPSREVASHYYLVHTGRRAVRLTCPAGPAALDLARKSITDAVAACVESSELACTAETRRPKHLAARCLLIPEGQTQRGKTLQPEPSPPRRFAGGRARAGRRCVGEEELKKQT
jgi:hypothetical protein